MTDQPADSFAVLWSAPSGSMTYSEALAVVTTHETEDLAALGVDATDPEGRTRAFADRELMAQHRGRQMRSVLALLQDRGEVQGLAGRMRAARLRVGQGSH